MNTASQRVRRVKKKVMHIVRVKRAMIVKKIVKMRVMIAVEVAVKVTEMEVIFGGDVGGGEGGGVAGGGAEAEDEAAEASCRGEKGRERAVGVHSPFHSPGKRSRVGTHLLLHCLFWQQAESVLHYHPSPHLQNVSASSLTTHSGS